MTVEAGTNVIETKPDDAAAAAAAAAATTTAAGALDATKAVDKPSEPAVVEPVAPVVEADTPVSQFLGSLKEDEYLGPIGGLFEGAGLSKAAQQEIFGAAFDSQDMSKIDKDKLAAKVGGPQAQMILGSISAYVAREKAKGAEKDKIIYDAVGGETVWATMAQWASKEMPKHEVVAYHKMLTDGGPGAILAAKEIKAKWSKATGVSFQSGKLIVGEGSGGVEAKPLTQIEFAKEYNAASRRNDKKGMESAIARRKLGREMGV